MSVYAHTPRGGGAHGAGSVYAQNPGGGTGSVYAQSGGKQKHHRGFLGRAAHFTADKVGRAAHDVKSIPGGVVELTTVEAKMLAQTARHPWVHGKKDPNYVGNTKAGKEGAALVHGLKKQTVESVKHPLRDPFITATTLLPVASAAGRAANVARTGELGALTRPFEPPPRNLRISGEDVPLHPSRGVIVRGAQHVHDTAVQRALDKRPESRLAGYGQRRAGHAMQETNRARIRLQEVPASMVESSARRVRKDNKIPRRTAQDALRLTSEQSTAEEAVRFHTAQARAGVNPRKNLAMAKRYAKVGELGLVKMHPTGRVVVDSERYPNLAELDRRIAKGQREVDKIAADYGLMTEEGLKTRASAPGRIRAGAKYVNPTPARLGEPSPGLVRQRSTVERLAQLHERATAKAQEGHFDPDQMRLLKAAEKLPAVTEAGAATRPRTVKEAQARLDKLDAKYEEFLSNIYEKKLTPAEQATQREINQSRGKYRRQQSGRTRGGKLSGAGGNYKVQRLEKNVSEQKRLEAENEAHRIAEKHKDMPAAQAFLKLSRERDELRTAIGAHEEAALTGPEFHFKDEAAARRALEIQETHLAAHHLPDDPSVPLARAEAAAARAYLRTGRNPERPPLGTVKGSKRVVREKAVHPLERPLPSGKVVMKGRILSPAGSARAERLGGALSVARDRLESMEKAAARRVEPTGIVGPQAPRPGRGYVSYRVVEPKAPRTAMAGAASPVLGKVKPFINRKTFTGHGLEHGMVPNNTAGLVAAHMRAAYRYVNTTRFRSDVYKTGSETRRSSRDVLVLDPEVTNPAKIPPSIDQALGRATITTDELAGHEVAFRDYMARVIPGLHDRFALDKAQQIGAPAPAGYRWVDRNILGDLARVPSGPRGRIATKVDSVNSAVTAATVYFKIGHLGTRALTNASANIIQGSASPGELAKSVTLWKQLSHEERLRSFAAAGQHGFDAMPHEGSNAVAKVATVGAHWWAKHIDAPFRFNSLAYEARRSGYRTPDEFRTMLVHMLHPEGLPKGEQARLAAVAKRANREAIAYDRLGDFERRFISRAVWFYPWIRGTAGFAANTFSEHPYKTAALATLGQRGRERQQREVGDLPSYEQGVFQLREHGNTPLVADFSTFSPFVTPAEVAEAAVHPGQLSGFLNPVASAGANLAFGLDQYGQPTNRPYGAAASSLFSPTPEAQIVTALRQRNQDQSARMFHKTPLNVLARTLVGPGLPRRLNKTAAHKAAKRELSGR
jgi:hypothetical protein